MLQEVDLTQWVDKPVKMFSGGMRSRLEIARELVHEPNIFFLHESTTGLDPVSRVAVTVVDPFTYAVHGFKQLVLKNTGLMSISFDIAFLVGFTVLAMSAATLLFRRTL